MEYEKTSSKTKYSSSVPVSVPLMNRSRGEFRKRLLQDDKVVSLMLLCVLTLSMLPIYTTVFIIVIDFVIGKDAITR